MKLHQHSSFSIKLHRPFICIEAMPIFIFAMKPHQHFICIKAVSTFLFAMMLCQYLPTFISAMMPHLNILFASKLRQHSTLPWSHIKTCIYTEVGLTFIFAMTPHQPLHSYWSRTNIGLYNEAWRCKKNDVDTLKMLDYAAKTLKMSQYALRGEMMQHQLQMLEEGDVVLISETWCETTPLRREMMWFKF